MEKNAQSGTATPVTHILATYQLDQHHTHQYFLYISLYTCYFFIHVHVTDIF